MKSYIGQDVKTNIFTEESDNFSCVADFVNKQNKVNFMRNQKVCVVKTNGFRVLCMLSDIALQNERVVIRSFSKAETIPFEKIYDIEFNFQEAH